jgi:hypothetical protein
MSFNELDGLIAVGEEGEAHQAVNCFEEAVIAHLVIKFLGMEDGLFYIEVEVYLSLNLLRIYQPMLKFWQLIDRPLAHVLRIFGNLINPLQLLLGQVLGQSGAH